MRAITSSGSLRRLFGISIAARLPLAMLTVGLTVHIQHLTGSFAAAGVVTAAYGLALGLGGPVLGRTIDRRGQTAVLVAAGVTGSLLLGAIAALPRGIPLAVPIALAFGVGVAAPPVDACLRALLPSLIADASALSAAYAFEAAILELTWVCGPPILLGVGALWSTGGALAAAAVVLLAFTLAFALQPASRGWKPAIVTERSRGGSLRAPGMRTLTLVLLGVGVLLGADEVALTAAARALDGTTAAAAPLLALWGAGSFIGGLIVTRFAGAQRSATGFVVWLGALAAGHLALIPAAGSAGALAATLLLAGVAISPAESAAYSMVDAVAPAGTVTEAFSWLLTALALGSALGAAAGGVLVERFGPAAGLGLGAGAGVLATLLAAARARTLTLEGPIRRSGAGTSACPTRPATRP